MKKFFIYVVFIIFVFCFVSSNFNLVGQAVNNSEDENAYYVFVVDNSQTVSHPNDTFNTETDSEDSVSLKEIREFTIRNLYSFIPKNNSKLLFLGYNNKDNIISFGEKGYSKEKYEFIDCDAELDNSLINILDDNTGNKTETIEVLNEAVDSLSGKKFSNKYIFLITDGEVDSVDYEGENKRENIDKKLKNLKDSIESENITLFTFFIDKEHFPDKMNEGEEKNENYHSRELTEISNGKTINVSSDYLNGLTGFNKFAHDYYSKLDTETKKFCYLSNCNSDEDKSISDFPFYLAESPLLCIDKADDETDEENFCKIWNGKITIDPSGKLYNQNSNCMFYKFDDYEDSEIQIENSDNFPLNYTAMGVFGEEINYSLHDNTIDLNNVYLIENEYTFRFNFFIDKDKKIEKIEKIETSRFINDFKPKLVFTNEETGKSESFEIKFDDNDTFYASCIMHEAGTYTYKVEAEGFSFNEIILELNFKDTDNSAKKIEFYNKEIKVDPDSSTHKFYYWFKPEHEYVFNLRDSILPDSCDDKENIKFKVSSDDLNQDQYEYDPDNQELTVYSDAASYKFRVTANYGSQTPLQYDIVFEAYCIVTYIIFILFVSISVFLAYFFLFRKDLIIEINYLNIERCIEVRKYKTLLFKYIKLCKLKEQFEGYCLYYNHKNNSDDTPNKHYYYISNNKKDKSWGYNSGDKHTYIFDQVGEIIIIKRSSHEQEKIPVSSSFSG